MPPLSNARKSIAATQTDGFMAIARAVKKQEEQSGQVISEALSIETSAERSGRMPSALTSMSRDNFPVLQQKIFLSLVYAVTTDLAERARGSDEIVRASKTQDVKDDWVIDAQLTRELARYDSRNLKHFRESVMALNGRTVKPNILGKDDEELLDTRRALFEGIGFVKGDGKIYFKFSDYVKIKIERLRFYCKFLSSYANSLKHGSSHAIYLLLLDYIDEKRGRGQTPFIEIDKFAKLIGGEKNLSSDFGSLRKYSIEPAIDEITAKTNIIALFDKYDDVKTSGRKVTAIRIRGRYKQSKPVQTTLFDDSPNNANAITLCNHTIDKEGFLEFLAKDANNKSAYKAHIRRLLDDNRLDDTEKRVSQYIAHINEQKLKAEQEAKQKQANEIYQTLSDIAVKEKGERLENLYLWDNDNGFCSFRSIIDEGKIIEMCSELTSHHRSKISKRMFTNAEKLSIEERETRRYEATIVRPLMAIAPKDSWTMIIDNQETKIFNHKTLISVIGDIAIGKLRKIERVIRSEGDITLKSDDRLYLGAFGNDGNLILTPIQQNTDSGK